MSIGALKGAQFPAHVTVHKPQSPSKRHSTETKRHSTETKAVQETKEQEDQAQKKEDIYSRYVSFDNNLIPHVKTIVNAFDFSIHQTAVDLGGTCKTLKCIISVKLISFCLGVNNLFNFECY